MSFRSFDITPGVSVAQLEEACKGTARVDRYLPAHHAFIHQVPGRDAMLVVSVSDMAERHITSIKRIDIHDEATIGTLPDEDLSRWMAL
jgi:hypothetical protein